MATPDSDGIEERLEEDEVLVPGQPMWDDTDEQQKTLKSVAAFVRTEVAAAQGSDDDRVTFFRALDSRLTAGAAAYGQRSFERPPAELVDELEQEALDIAGWGYVLWVRLRRLREQTERLK